MTASNPSSALPTLSGRALDAEDVRPFSTGTEGYDWLAANCDRCAKNGPPNRDGVGPCPMETAVSLGFVIGTVPAALAVEYGATLAEQPGYCRMPKQCTRFAPLPRCESLSTRNRRMCGEPATSTVEHKGLVRPTCARHRRTYLAAIARSAAAPLSERTETDV